MGGVYGKAEAGTACSSGEAEEAEETGKVA
jgi:hypothetical protein